MDLNRINTPTLLLDKTKALANISLMIAKSEAEGVDFRPHFKTHQSIEIGRLFRDKSVSKITVASVKMAEYFLKDNWNDILIAFPFNPREIDSINKLADKINLTLTVPCIESASLLTRLAKTKMNVMIKIDTGYGRSGTNWNDSDTVIDIIKVIGQNQQLTVSGLLTHSGHTYKKNNPIDIERIFQESIERLHIVKQKAGRDDLIISVGDTPSASIVSTFEGADEIRPGNFVFYDLMQLMIGSCSLADIALVAACPVIDIQKDRKKAVIYGGGVHLSKESILHKGESIYGLVVILNNEGWSFYEKEIFVTGLSQEHGIISNDKPLPEEIEVGALIGIIPVHSCLTANLLAEYYDIDGSIISHMNKN
jgi:D-serine deaminase-like pyridoxal phosphate-dependent protein